MKKTDIRIEATFGSQFQDQIARDTLMMMLKTWRTYMHGNHKKNSIDITINGDKIHHLDWFNWISFRKKN
jgi:hypothetical protein